MVYQGLRLAGRKIKDAVKHPYTEILAASVMNFSPSILDFYTGSVNHSLDLLPAFAFVLFLHGGFRKLEQKYVMEHQNNNQVIV